METIKKNQSDMKNALNEMKNNLQGINSEINKAKNQICNLEYKEEKTPNQNRRKKKNKNKDSVKDPLGQLQVYQYLHDGDAGRKRERTTN